MLIGKQKEKLGIHDLWMQKRKLEWRTVPVEKYGTCVKEDMEGEMKWLLWHFLACAPDTFGEKYDLTQLYRNGILYGTGEIKELRFLAEQPCAVYEGMNVGIVRERGGIPDGDARIRIDDSTELGIYLLEEQESEDERTPPSVFSSWEEVYYREPDSRKRERLRYLSPDLSLAAGEGICFQTFDELKERREKRLAWFGTDSKWLVQKKLIWME